MVAVLTAETAKTAEKKRRSVVGQGTVKKRGSASSPRGWGIKFYALVVSIIVHAAAFSIFAGIKLSQSTPPLQKTAASVSISQASILAEIPAIAPKPKVIPESQGRKIMKPAQQGFSTNIGPVFDSPKQSTPSQMPAINESNPQDKQGDFQNIDGLGNDTTARVEFFESAGEGRRICYVVDCSGSMQGLWGQVKAELSESIGQLQPDQYFSVIVFGGDDILESGGGILVRATQQAKKDAYDFIASVRPKGATNATAALEHAIKIQDRLGQGPSVIYFLTDGFELNNQDNARFAHQVETMRRGFSPETQINTIGFWPDRRDKKLLETIAAENGGQFTLVGQEKKNNDWE